MSYTQDTPVNLSMFFARSDADFITASLALAAMMILKFILPSENITSGSAAGTGSVVVLSSDVASPPLVGPHAARLITVPSEVMAMTRESSFLIDLFFFMDFLLDLDLFI